MTFLQNLLKRALSACLRAKILVLIFVLGFLSGIAYTAYRPALAQNIRFTVTMIELSLTKELLGGPFRQEHVSIGVWGERIEGGVVGPDDIKLIGPVIEDAFDQFPLYMRQRHNIRLPELPDMDKLAIIFVSERTYEIFDRQEKTFSSGRINWSGIYIPCPSHECSVTMMLAAFLHDEEGSAEYFADWKAPNR